MNYGFAIFPNREVQQLANSYRKRYDPHYPLIPPHITLKESFKVKDEHELNKLIHKTEQIAKSISPFKLHFNKVSSFYPNNNTIYLAIEEEPQLLKLHELLHEGELKTERRYGFSPHLTIAQKLSSAELQDIYGSLKLMDIKAETVVDRFHLLYQIDDGTWTVYQTFILGK